MKKKLFYYTQPLIYALILSIGLLLGINISKEDHPPIIFFSNSNKDFQKIDDILTYIQKHYVDTINKKELLESTINCILQNLDPHSYYIPKEELTMVVEPLQGNFEGIGIEFNIQHDTIMVVNTINGGPSEQVGIRPGDRIIKVNNENVAGIKIKNQDVIKRLRGKKGTKVNVTILRPGVNRLLDFTIIRDKIPTYSIDAAFMIDKETGYIKLSKFSATTNEEFKSASEKLLQQGMKNLIFDLRGNGGGFLESAVSICNYLLPKDKLIVYTEGRTHKRKEYFTTRDGKLSKINLYILIDEWSASASEIVAGAVQDNDRGTIIGRRSFGKGLVQEQIILPDSSAIRLTIARYYTPTGRCIQKDYSKGTEKYYLDFIERYQNGELLYKDSLNKNDTIKYVTSGGRIVYGGGGIYPDVFVPYDTSETSNYLSYLISKNIFNQFTFDYVDKNRNYLLKTYSTESHFYNNFIINEKLLNSFIEFASKNGIKYNEKEFLKSKNTIMTNLKALTSKYLYGNYSMYKILLENDNVFKRTIELIKNKS